MTWFDAEPAPAGVSDELARRFGYRTFSARTGNIYTTSLLRQWTRWALDEAPVPSELWTSGTRVIDPFRPRIEPEGFDSVETLRTLRARTLDSFRACITQSHVFVFTLGLTESWFHASGYEYPMCPGTAHGTFDPSQHRFVNQRYNAVRDALVEAIRLMRSVNPQLKILLTVSPVPLTATMSDEHVLVATMQSKSTLRAVAGDLAAEQEYVDYFPSYEIINSPAYRGVFFEPNMRSVSPTGVATVMHSFFAAQADRFGPLAAEKPDPGDATPDALDITCDEETLAAFGPAA